MIGAPLAQPIRGSVARDGRLVSADDALRRLHLRAGGTEGGQLAIPALAALAALAHQLKMRMSRAVKVADVDEDLELWVDAGVEGDLARLSILSWRALPSRGSSELAGYESFDAVSELQFDAQLRLIGATGFIAAQLKATDFGRSLNEIFAQIADSTSQTAELIELIKTRQVFARLPIHLADATPGLVSGTPQFSKNDALQSYCCTFTENEGPVERLTVATPTPGVLFGRQLAPALRQPLGRIIANAETIGGELNGPIRENYALYAKDIANAARHLIALVDDLGDLEAVERADFVTAKDNIELGDVARRVAGLLALKAADHSIRIVVPTEAHTVPAVAEFRRVLQILLNLVTNAVRYSPDGTEVHIDIATADDAALVMVSDQGAGIAPEDRERVFEKFERLGRSGDGGSGLGLYISRTLARAMGGDLTVESAASGGAKFTLRLPVC